MDNDISAEDIEPEHLAQMVMDEINKHQFKKAMVIFLDDDDEKYHPRFLNMGMKTSEMLGLLGYVQCWMVNIIDGKE